MTVVLGWSLLGLMLVGGAGTATFAVRYWLRSDWRASPIGRHLLVYSATLSVLYTVSIATAFFHPLWMALVILPLHAIFDAVIWQRVVLHERALRAGPAKGRRRRDKT